MNLPVYAFSAYPFTIAQIRKLEERIGGENFWERKARSKILRSNGVSLNRRASVATDDWNRVVWHRVRRGMRNSIDEDEEGRIQFVSLRANQFPWAVVRGIFNKKTWHFLRLFLSLPFHPLISPCNAKQRKRIRLATFSYVCVYICRSVTTNQNQPLNNPRASSPYKQRFASVVLSIPFSPRSARLTPMADHLLPRFIFSHPRARGGGGEDHENIEFWSIKEKIVPPVTDRSYPLLAIFHDCSSNNKLLRLLRISFL